MNFTREPIIETVISPREGCKLVLRSSKTSGGEDYYVDAVEVVSFGSSIFYCSMERPKSFLLPVADYEVLELKETRMVLKNASSDKSSIKIGGGKEKETTSEAKEPAAKKRRSRRKKSEKQISDPSPKKEESHKEGEAASEEVAASPILSKLLPPPPKLIKEHLSSKEKEEVLDANIVEKEVGEALDSPAEDKLPSEVEIPQESAWHDAKKEPLDEPAHADEVKEEKED